MAQPLPTDTKSDGFKEAVRAEVEARTAALARQVEALSQLIEEQKQTARALQPPVKDLPDLKAIFEHLGMALADISAQGVGVQKPVAPEVLRMREEATARMAALIKKARAEGKKPRYSLVAATFIGNGLRYPSWIDKDHIERPTEIEYSGVPNLAMKPINDVAREIHAAFCESIGNVPKPKTLAEEEVIEYGAPKAEPPEGLPGRFEAEEDEVRDLNADRGGRARRVHILGTLAPPAVISG